MCVKSLVNQIVKIEASDILAGNDISVEGENVDITGKDNISHSTEKHEYKRSGLTVSVGGDTITALSSVAVHAVRATEVKDARLKALYGYDAYKQTQTGKVSEEWANLKKGKADISLSVGISNVSSKSESRVTATEAQGSSLAAGNDVNIRTAEDITINGSDVTGQKVTLNAGENLNITAAEEYTKQKTAQTSKGGSIGVSIKAGAITGVEGSLYSAKEKENGETVSYRGSTITAENTMMMESGKNTNIIGSKVSGDKIVADIGGNLNIESLQETNTYREESKSAGISVSTDIGFTQYGTSASAGKGSMRSDYASVQEQAGIYAGEEGFHINVKDNTDLKGAVIASEADGKKNTLTTGTLSWEDIGNSADYKASGAGISYVSKDSGAKLNEKGVTPNIAPTVKDNEGSTTKSAIAEGTINVTDTENQKQDVGCLSRNTDDSLNRLKEIFYKDSVAEKQELIGMLEKEGNQLIHEYADKKGWKDGSEEKILLHAAFGALIGDMSGGSVAGGALAGGINEYVVGYLEKTKGEAWMEAHSDTVQWVSAGVGAAVGSVSGDVSVGSTISLMGTKWNELSEKDEKSVNKVLESLNKKDLTDLDELIDILKMYEMIGIAQDHPSAVRGIAESPEAWYGLSEKTKEIGDKVYELPSVFVIANRNSSLDADTYNETARRFGLNTRFDSKKTGLQNVQTLLHDAMLAKDGGKTWFQSESAKYIGYGLEGTKLLLHGTKLHTIANYAENLGKTQDAMDFITSEDHVKTASGMLGAAVGENVGIIVTAQIIANHWPTEEISQPVKMAAVAMILGASMGGYELGEEAVLGARKIFDNWKSYKGYWDYKK